MTQALHTSSIDPLKAIWEASQSDPSFGNGRGVRNIFEQILAKQATRVVGQKRVAKAALTTIEKVDIPVASNMFNAPKPKNKIGFAP